MKRLTALLALVMVVGLAVGCGPKKDPKADEPAGAGAITAGLLYYDVQETYGPPTKTEGGDPNADANFSGTCTFNTPEGPKTVQFEGGKVKSVQ